MRGGVADMTKAAMRQDDQLERAALAAGVGKFSAQPLPRCRSSPINQDVTGAGPDQLAVHLPQAQGQWKDDHVGALGHI